MLDGHGVSRLDEDASTRAASTLDGMTESGVTVHHEMTTALDDKTAMLWQQLGAELTGLVDDPSSVTLVVTDQMPAVIGKLEAKVPWQFGGQDAAATYTPDKPDGARASAKTLQLADETVVVVDSAVVHFGKATTRRIVHHEAQHAWLRQAEDMAWAMQRRAAFTRPAGNIFAFVYLAQSMVDEYRCEAALTPEVSQADKLMTVSPNDWIDVAAVFAQAQDLHQITGDVSATFALVLGGLDRVSSFLGYAAATIARGEYTPQQWSQVGPLALVANPLLGTPPAGTPVGYDGLGALVEGLTASFGRIAQSFGFLVEVDETTDQTSMFLIDPEP